MNAIFFARPPYNNNDIIIIIILDTYTHAHMHTAHIDSSSSIFVLISSHICVMYVMLYFICIKIRSAAQTVLLLVDDCVLTVC